MNKLFRKVLSFILILAMLIIEYPLTNIAQAAGGLYASSTTWYETDTTAYPNPEYFNATLYSANLGALPTLPGGNKYPLYITVKGVKYYLNYKIFHQKNLFVYGNYNAISGNYFKCGYQIHTDLTELMPDFYYDGGYFKKTSGIVCKGIEQNPDEHPDTCATRGEWKYLGYDVTGNPFSNMWMINVATKTKYANRNWQPTPWSNALQPYTKLNRISTYNESAYGLGTVTRPEVISKVQAWIANTVPLDSSGNHTVPTKTVASGSSSDVYKFMYIQSPPTTQAAGSGKMWHLLSNGQYWYQTYSVPKLTTKLQLPVTCEITGASTPGSVPDDADTSFDSHEVTLTFKLKATLSDDAFYNDDASKTVYYTRYDLKEWTFNLQIPSLGVSIPNVKVNHVRKNINGTWTNVNYVETTVSTKTTIQKLRALPKATSGVNIGKREIYVTADAKPKYKDDKLGLLDSTSGKYPVATTVQPTPPPEPEEPYLVDIPQININNHIGDIAFDDVPFDDVSDGTNIAAVQSTEVFVNGVQVPYNEFFSKNYVFPNTTTENGYIAQVVVRYTLDKSKIVMTGISPQDQQKILNANLLEYISTDWVFVYPTKPHAHFSLSSNTWKQNRIINAANDSVNSNIQLVANKFPLVEYRWSYGGDTTKLYKGTDTDLAKQLQYKEPGTYTVTLEARNTLGKWSDPYIAEFEVLEDYGPNIEANLTSSVLVRGDELSAWHYDLNSTDGDKVGTSRIELWYDSDNNGTTETKLQTWDGLGGNGLCEIDDFPKYKPTQLGYYKYKIYAQDEFVGVSGQDTLSQYVTSTDKKSNTYEYEFWVDNYQPLSDLYIDVNIDRPNLDLYIMRDANLSEDKMQYISENRVNMENWLLGKNIIPQITAWNMKTYQYSTPASTSNTTGTSYPPATVYYESAGYTGTLSLYSAPDNGGNRDYGSYVTLTDYKDASSSVSGTVTILYTYNGSSWTYTSSSGTNNSSSSTMSYGPDAEGYSGTLTKGSGYKASSVGTAPSNPKKGNTYTVTETWIVPYNGRVSRTHQEWSPNYVWVSNYTGYYSGTIYKNVREPYTNPWRSNSTKYLLYFSDSGISEINDFAYARSKSDAKIILAGTPQIVSQSGYDKFIDVTGKSAEQVMEEVLAYIGQNSPDIQYQYILQNQTFTLNFGEQDLDGDAIVSREMQYVHEKDFFDNPTGQETGTLTTPSSTTGWSATVKNSFANVGKYRVFRRVKDKPGGAYGDVYSYYSGATEVDIYVHRKPVAQAALDWDFDPGTGTYRTTWVDQSYDLDHSVTRVGTDKGIKERKIMWRKELGEWNYTIPDRLSPGTYTLRYYARDLENAWSDVFTINLDGNIHTNVPEVTFTLADTPPMQFEGKLRALNPQFRIPDIPVTIPAGENLELYDLWTRYPTNPILYTALYNSSGGQATPVKTTSYSTGTGTKNQNDISWNPIRYNAPVSLWDGTYYLKISASAQNSRTLTFPVTIKTPINLKATINGKTSDAQINTGDYNTFTFKTSTYVTSVELKFEGTTYTSSSGKISLLFNDGTTKTWQYSANIPDGALTDGRTGNAEFKAILPSGMNEVTYVNYNVVGIKATNFLITMIQDIGWRPYYFDTANGIDDNHDGEIDRYPRRSNTNIGTLKLPVNYYSLISYEKTFVKAGYLVKGQIDIIGSPDTAGFRIYYRMNKSGRTDYVNLLKSSGNTYLFEWVIPVETDSNSFVTFDLVTKKGTNTYGNEKWLDSWDSRNLDRKVFYVKGNAYEDLLFVQSH